MPEPSNPKTRPQVTIHKPTAKSRVAYAELHVTSNFSFLHGASHPEELVAHACEAGCHAVAMTDTNTLAGIVRGHVAGKEAGMPFIVGCHLKLKAAVGALAYGAPHVHPLLSVLVYPTTRAAYGRLCRLLTFGKRQADKGDCKLTLQDLFDYQQEMLAIAVPPSRPAEGFAEAVGQLKEVFTEDRLSIAVSRLYEATDMARTEVLAELSQKYRVPLVATNDVHYHIAERKSLQDILTCIRLGCTRAQAGLELYANAERHIKGPEEMARLFRDYPKAITRTVAIAERARAFSLDQIKYEYPHEICPPGKDMMQHLRDLTWQGAQERYAHLAGGVPQSVKDRLAHEFELIAKLNYAAYFLTVYDMVQFARSRGILCQGRGAAANSAVCYCLGVTSVDPSRINLLVERFISEERNEPPDIDIDFEHERREEVIQYLYSKYGRERAALTAEVISYRRRSAIRDVGKAIGLSLDCVDHLAKAGDWWDDGVIDPKRMQALGVNPHDQTLLELVKLASELIGFPRHLSQHVGGFVLTNTPLCEIVPIENAAMQDRTVIEWDKDDIDAMGMLKVDALALGMMTAIQKAFAFINQLRKFPYPLALHTLPPDDPAVYDMLCKADSIGVFQVESRAQMTMLPRLQPRCYYDIVIEVSIVRPGPIVGNMVHPYLRRRRGQEPVTYPSEAIKSVLERTLGVPLFQEQVMRIVMVAAGFTPGEADQLRRAMAAWKRKGHIMERFGQKIIAGMDANGYSPVFAHRLLEQIKGFGEYGFPESHAASFAHLVYASAWLKCYHPAAFCAALVNSQPMGFYQPAQLIRDAKDHGVEIRGIDVNHSTWDCTLETNPPASRERPAVRLGMRLVKGLRKPEADLIAAAVQRHGHMPGIEKLWRQSTVRVSTLKALAEADAFASMGLTRQTALWAIQKLKDDDLPIFDGIELKEQEVVLPHVPEQRLVVYDYAATGLSLKAHPISFIRDRLHQLKVTPNRDLANEARCRKGQIVTVAGLVLVRQRPGTASGVIFATIEDETGVANLIILPHIYEQFRPALRHSISLIAKGKLEREGLVIHVNVTWAADLQTVAVNETVAARSRDFH